MPDTTTPTLGPLTFAHPAGHPWVRYFFWGAAFSLSVRIVLAFASALAKVGNKTIKYSQKKPPTPFKGRRALWRHMRQRVWHLLRTNPKLAWQATAYTFRNSFANEMLGKGVSVNDAGLSFLLGWMEFLVYPVLMLADGWTFIGGWMAAKIAVIWKSGQYGEPTFWEKTRGRTKTGHVELRAERQKEDRDFRNRFTIYMLASALVLGICYFRALIVFKAPKDKDRTTIADPGPGPERKPAPVFTVGPFASTDTVIRAPLANKATRLGLRKLLGRHADEAQVIFIIGRTDKNTLHGWAGALYGENTTLAMARARYVRQLAFEESADPHALLGKLVLLNAGATHYGTAVDPISLAADRSVTVIPIMR